MIIKQNKFILYIAFFLIISFASTVKLMASDIAIIANVANGIEDLNIEDIRKIFKAEKQFWRNGKKIRLIMRPIDSKESRVLLQKVYNMPREGFKLFWLEKIYGGIVTEPPTIISSASMVNILVGQLQWAIAPIEVGKISEWAKVKIIKINGKMPGEDGYPLNIDKGHGFAN